MSEDRQDLYWVGFDLGGTKMLAVLFDPQLQPIARKRKRTDGQAGQDAGVKRIIGVIQALLAEANVSPEQVRGIGLGCPGPLDLDRGIVLETPNLGWKKVCLEAALREAFGCPTVLATMSMPGSTANTAWERRGMRGAWSAFFPAPASAAAPYTRGTSCAAVAALASKSGISPYCVMALLVAAAAAGAWRRWPGD